MSPILAFEVFKKIFVKILLLGRQRNIYQKNRDNEPEQADGATEDLHDEDLDEERGVGGV